MSQLEFFNVPSPCVGICQSDDKGQCIGCFRTRDERSMWISLSSADKQRVIKRCKQRKNRKEHVKLFEFKGRSYQREIRQFFEQRSPDDKWSKVINDMYGFDKKSIKSAIQDLSSLNFDEFDSKAVIDLAKPSQKISSSIELEVVTALTNNNYEALSEKALNYLYFLLCNIIMPIILAVWIIPEIQETIKNLDSELKSATNKSDVREIIRKFDTNLLSGGYRVMIKNSVNIRSESSIKSEIIGVLELGEVVEVIESENRSWLKVKIIGGEQPLTGWVFRRYTLAIK